MSGVKGGINNNNQQTACKPTVPADGSRGGGFFDRRHVRGCGASGFGLFNRRHHSACFPRYPIWQPAREGNRSATAPCPRRCVSREVGSPTLGRVWFVHASTSSHRGLCPVPNRSLTRRAIPSLPLSSRRSLLRSRGSRHSGSCISTESRSARGAPPARATLEVLSGPCVRTSQPWPA